MHFVRTPLGGGTGVLVHGPHPHGLGGHIWFKGTHVEAGEAG